MSTFPIISFLHRFMLKKKKKKKQHHAFVVKETALANTLFDVKSLWVREKLARNFSTQVVKLKFTCSLHRVSWRKKNIDLEPFARYSSAEGFKFCPPSFVIFLSSAKIIPTVPVGTCSDTPRWWRRAGKKKKRWSHVPVPLHSEFVDGDSESWLGRMSQSSERV